MPRTPRETSPLKLYHVCDRGVDKRRIFDDDRDRERFVEHLRRSIDSSGGDLLAWCLMTSHIHLVVQMEKDDMSQSMQRLLGDYSRYYNTRHGRSGYLFQDRFRSQPIDSEQYLFAAVRYVHQNPLKAHMVRDCNYPWSSYPEYLGVPMLTKTDVVLGTLGGKDGFLSLHEQTEDDPRLIDFDNGWRMDGDEAWDVACRVLGPERAEELPSLEKAELEKCIFRLLAANIRGTHIAEMAHISPASVSRIRSRLLAQP